jgi:hypothetical protein
MGRPPGSESGKTLDGTEGRLDDVRMEAAHANDGWSSFRVVVCVCRLLSVAVRRSATDR